MPELESYFNHYKGGIKQIIRFLKDSFGEVDYLKMKNAGLIPSRNYDIKASPITGYSFHGNGCGFQFKNFEIDVELIESSICFTAWSFYIFLQDNELAITEKSANEFLFQKVKQNKLIHNNGVFYLPETDLSL